MRGGATLLWRHCWCGECVGLHTCARSKSIAITILSKSCILLRVYCMMACPTIDPENGWLGDALLTINMDTCGQDLEAWCSRGRPSITPSLKDGRHSGSVLQPCVRELIILPDYCSFQSPTYNAMWHGDAATLWCHSWFAECVRVGLYPGARLKSVAITIP